MPRRVSHPIDVPMFTGLSQRVLRLDDTRAKCANGGERPTGEAHACTAYRARWRDRQSTDVGGTPLRRRALWPPPGGSLNAPGRLAGRAPAATLAPEDGRCPTRWNAESFGTGFHRHRPEHQWVTDITYIRTAEHWLYLCIVLDLYSGLVVGWSMSPRQDRQLVVQAVLMAVWQRPGRTPVILHSDRGCQFMSDEYQQFLAAHHVTCSMSAVGSCADNAAAESFFGVLKRERVNRRQYRTRAEARADLFDYIERWHNPRQRRKLAFQQEGEKLLIQVSAETG